MPTISWERSTHSLGFALLLLLVSAAPSDGQEFAIAGSRVVEYSSESVGASYELHIASNSEAEIARGLPLVILLDSNEDFPLVTAISRRLFDAGHLPEFLLVGVGYPEYPRYYRSRDYTPSVGTRADRPSGGAEAFSHFLATELIPWVETEYGTSSKRVLVGHSIGGLFGVYATMQTPGTYSGVVASSPAVWWGEEEVLDRLDTESALEGLRVFTSLGSDETELMTVSWNRLRRVLSRHGSEFEHHAEIFDGEDHSSVKPFAFSRGLRWVFRSSGPGSDS